MLFSAAAYTSVLGIALAAYSRAELPATPICIREKANFVG